MLKKGNLKRYSVIKTIIKRETEIITTANRRFARLRIL